MHHFLDLEACSYTGRVISLGSKSLQNMEYHSLVNSDCHLSGFITNLTGITQEMHDNAPTFDEVILELNAKFNFKEVDTFVFFGKDDAKFLKNSLRKVENEEVKDIVNLMLNNYLNFNSILKTRKKIRDYNAEKKITAVGLKKAYELFLNKEYNQTHNALEDAEALKQLYIAVLFEEPFTVKEEKELITSFRKTLDKIVAIGDKPASKEEKNALAKGNAIHKYHCLKGKATVVAYHRKNNIFHYFSTVKMARTFLKITDVDATPQRKNQVSKAIGTACRNNTKRFGYEWSLAVQ